VSVLLGKQPKNTSIVFCPDCDKNNNSYYEIMKYEHLAHHFQLIVVYSHKLKLVVLPSTFIAGYYGDDYSQ